MNCGDVKVRRDLQLRRELSGLAGRLVPVGLVDGLPAGIQIVGRRFREDLILDAMVVIEAQIGVTAKTLWARET